MPPSLVLVPGLGLDATAWLPTLAGLDGTTRARSVVLELPGHGRRGPSPDRGPAALAEQLLVRLPVSRTCVLVGHSASCQVVAHAAARRPDLVTGLVLIGPTTDPRAASWRALTGRWWATALHEDPRQVPTLVRQYSRTGVRAMYRAMDAARHDDIQAALQQTACPVLVLRGVHDRICPGDWADRVLATSPGGTRSPSGTQSVPGGAHMVPLTHGHQVATRLAKFVTDLPG